LMLAITFANSKGLPIVSFMVPRTFMVWAEREREKINKRKGSVLYIEDGFNSRIKRIESREERGSAQYYYFKFQLWRLAPMGENLSQRRDVAMNFLESSTSSAPTIPKVLLHLLYLFLDDFGIFFSSYHFSFFGTFNFFRIGGIHNDF